MTHNKCLISLCFPPPRIMASIQRKSWNSVDIRLLFQESSVCWGNGFKIRNSDTRVLQDAGQPLSCLHSDSATCSILPTNKKMLRPKRFPCQLKVSTALTEDLSSILSHSHWGADNCLYNPSSREHSTFSWTPWELHSQRYIPTHRQTPTHN